jgi:hypothetical protein
MGTRSMIAIENPHSKAVKSIYCHWDGYLQHNGSLLEKHYPNSPKVNNLIALGDLSSLGTQIGEAHPFSPHTNEADKLAYEAAKEAGFCTFYTRDRGEDAPYKFFPTIKEAIAYYDGSWCEYFYLFRYDADLETGKWFYRTRENGRWKRLATALKKFKAEDVA